MFLFDRCAVGADGGARHVGGVIHTWFRGSVIRIDFCDVYNVGFRSCSGERASTTTFAGSGIRFLNSFDSGDFGWEDNLSSMLYWRT